MSKPVILTGIRSNEDPTIGNYFGALLPLIDMAKNHADDYQINLFVPDLHSFTTPIHHAELYKRTLQNLKIFVAAGLPLDHPNVHIYRQSYIPAHSELTWILDCFSSFGQIARMTQFKDKLALNSDTWKMIQKRTEVEMDGVVKIIHQMSREEAKLSELNDSLKQWIDEIVTYRTLQYTESTVGLFNYPVLMAADILLYNGKYIPVGDDQRQHLEFARDIAIKMNTKFGELFTVPEPVKKQHEFFGKDQGLRIKDLVDPTKKMSKSDTSGKGVIFLGDDPEIAAKKIKSATTDSFGKIDIANQDQPGIRNLIQILALTNGLAYEEVAQQYHGQALYGSLKAAVAEAVGVFLDEFQQRLKVVDESALLAKLTAGEAQMNSIANATLLKVQRAVGLRA